MSAEIEAEQPDGTELDCQASYGELAVPLCKLLINFFDAYLVGLTTSSQIQMGAGRSLYASPKSKPAQCLTSGEQRDRNSSARLRPHHTPSYLARVSRWLN